MVVRETPAVKEGKAAKIPAPYQRHTFGHEWRSIATKAGIPLDLQFRDLRATALIELANSGADIIPLSTHGGYETLQIAKRYAGPTVAQFRTAARQWVEHRAEDKLQRNSRASWKITSVED
ncbi:MAG: tyrosine-type recombinase/integrase [Janthinobacterium lividum]